MYIITGGKQTSAAASVHSAFPFFCNIFFFLSAVGIMMLQLVCSQIHMESNNIKTEKKVRFLEGIRETNTKPISKIIINAISSFNENDKKNAIPD